MVYSILLIAENSAPQLRNRYF